MGHVYVIDPVAHAVIERLRRRHTLSFGYGAAATSWQDIASSVDAILVRGSTVPAEWITAAPRLRIVARHGVGTDNVDLRAAAEAGVSVTTTPGGNARAVAEHVFALLLTLVRHTNTAHQNVQAGHWSQGRVDLVGVQLHNKSLLLIGGGAIARMVIPIARGFGMQVRVADPYLPPDEAVELGVDLVDLDDELPRTDVVSVHAPLTNETTHLLNARRLSLLRSTSYVINTSRGGLVDEIALIQLLRAGRIAGAGLDVIEAEHIDMLHPLSHSSTSFDVPGLLVTPHIAGQTTESLDAVGMMAAESIEHALAGQVPPRMLTLPSFVKGT